MARDITVVVWSMPAEKNEFMVNFLISGESSLRLLARQAYCSSKDSMVRADVSQVNSLARS
jgi:hypothetical protein